MDQNSQDGAIPFPECRHAMSNRQRTLLWMKDLIDHMSQCHEQLQWAADGRTERFLTDRLLGDLVECQKLCEQLDPRVDHSRALLGAV